MASEAVLSAYDIQYMINDLTEVQAVDDITGLCDLVKNRYIVRRSADQSELTEDPPAMLFPGLIAAISQFENSQKLKIEGSPHKFFGTEGLLQHLVSTAHQINSLFPTKTLPLLTRQTPQGESISFTAAQAHCLLANAFFLNIGRIPLVEVESSKRRHITRTIPHFGSITFIDLYRSRSKVGIASILCFLSYFEQVRLHLELVSPSRLIRATRHRDLDPLTIEHLLHCFPPLAAVSFHTSTVEKSSANIHIDFANEDLHVGAIWPCATQEEILFSIRPEYFIFVMLSETMDTNEAISLSGGLQFSMTTGFQNRFRWVGVPKFPQSDVSIIAIDALVSDGLQHQLLDCNMLRDISKARLGFGVKGFGDVVSAGLWGCGAFGGDPSVKFLEQV